MSIYNKAKDRDKKDRIDRKFTRNPGKRLTSTPKWWVKEFMTRPKRCQNKRLCRAILIGKNPEELVFPLGNKKPHLYSW